MKIAIMQPYFLPYIGYFQLINTVDYFVIYDDVNFIKKGWINRNYILENKSRALVTISLKKVSQNKLINEIEINKDSNSSEKVLKRVKQNYSKAPHFKKVFPIIESIINSEESVLSLFAWNSIEKVCEYLGINTKFILSSELLKNNTLKGEEKILDICKILNTNEYINPIGGIDLYSKEIFLSENIDLKFLKTGKVLYKQYEKNTFIPNLSIIDVIMFNSREETLELMKEYTLF